MENPEASAPVRQSEKPKTHAERVTALRTTLDTFYANEPLKLSRTQKGSIDPERILDAPDQKSVHGFIFSPTLAYTTLPDGQCVTPAVDTENGALRVVKMMPEEKLVRQKARYGIPGAYQDVEHYLANKGFNNPHVLMPVKSDHTEGFVVRAYEVGTEDLETFLERVELVDCKTALSLAIRISDGAYALHNRGVVHGDIAPLNVILFPDTVKLTDLDAATVIAPDGKFRKQKAEDDWDRWGNRFILPPEMFADAPEFDASVDTYQIAAMLYRMMVGKWPYNAESTTRELPYHERMEAYRALHASGRIDFPDNIPTEVRSIVKKAMNPKPSRRYESARLFILDLLAAYNVVDRRDFLGRIAGKDQVALLDSIGQRRRVLRTVAPDDPRIEKVTWELQQLKDRYTELQQQSQTQT